MKPAMLKSVFIFMTLLLGLVSNLLIYNSSLKYYTTTGNIQDGLCSGTTLTIKSVSADESIESGVPLQSVKVNKTKVPSSTCSPSGDYLPASVRIHYLGTFMNGWQFYANWAIWTLPWIGVLYAARRKYAHNRH